MAEWERQPGEPPRWFERFDRFFRTQPATDRSLLAAYNGWRSESGRDKATGAPMTWQNNAKVWRWQERATAWDEAQRLARHAREAELQENQRLIRRGLLNQLQIAIDKALKTLAANATDMTPKEILAAVQLALEENRIEYGEEGAHKGGGEIVIRFAGNVDMDKL